VRLYFDLETYQGDPTLDLTKVGLYRYLNGVEIDLFGYAIDDSPVQVWDNRSGEPFPSDLANALANADEYLAHNAPFDVNVLEATDIHTIPLDKVVCTQAQALAHGYPSSLAQVGEALGLPQDKAKDKEGKRLVARFCKPAPDTHKADRYGPGNDPERWAQYVEYCRRDVEALREIRRILPAYNYPNNLTERNLWQLDQKINARGLPVDVAGVDAALRTIEAEKIVLNEELSRVTNGELTSANAGARVLEWLRARNVPIFDLQKGSVIAVLEKAILTPQIRRVLEIRQQASMTSTSKYASLKRSTGSDGRLRGTLQFCGAARTGRWSGRLFQPQNLMRPVVDGELAMRAMKAGIANTVYGNVMEAAGSAVRSAIKAPKGYKLVVSDLANIEGRVLAWLAGEEWKLEAFRNYDKGTGPDLYKLAYARAFHVLVELIDSDQRQLGKVMELALGYQGGVGAFQTMAATYGVDISDEKADELKTAWRLANSAIKAWWWSADKAAFNALCKPGTTFLARNTPFKVVKYNGIPYLVVGLPSGRTLFYAHASIEDREITYMGLNQYTRKWERLKTYGGKFVENICQAVARDVMAHNMPAIETAEFAIVGTVHDEILTLAPEDKANHKALCNLLATNPRWARDLPLVAKGYVSERYRK